MRHTVDPAVAQHVLELQTEPEEGPPEAIRDYLVRLLHDVWEQRDEFDGKRPFGYSDWADDLHVPLARAGLIAAERDGDGILVPLDREAGDELVAAAIQRLGTSPGASA